MSQVIPHIVKTRLPAGLQFSLKYSDLEGCLAAHLNRQVGVSVYFSIWQQYRDTPKELILPTGDHHVASLQFNPEPVHFGHHVELWGEPGVIPVVRARVYALSHDVLRDTGLDHVFLSEQQTEALAEIPDLSSWRDRWELFALLRSDLMQLELRTRTWTGLRPEDERRRQVPLDPERARSRR